MYYIITIATIVASFILTAIAPTATSGVTAATSDVANVGGITRIEEVDYVDFDNVATSSKVDRSAELDYIAVDAAHLSADKYRTIFKDTDAALLANAIYNIVDDMGDVFQINKDLEHILVVIGQGHEHAKYAYFYSVFDAAYYCGTTPADTGFIVFIPEDYHLSQEEVDIIKEINSSYTVHGETHHAQFEIDTYYSLSSEHMLTEEREAKLRAAWLNTPEYTPALLEDLEELSSLL